MNQIDGFFSKLKSAFASQSFKKETISAVCLLHSKTTLTPSQIEIHGQVIKLNTGSAVKSAIFLKKAQILADLKEKIKPALIDIR